MVGLLTSAEFWFGGFMLCAYQIAKFGELNSLDPLLSSRAGIVPNLRASDFMGRSSFLGALTLFLFVTLLGYFLLCLASPTFLGGLVRVTTDATDANEITDFVASVPYPLYLAAAFMGLTHKGIPGFSNIANLQRNVFHYWIGVPRLVLQTSSEITVQIFADAATKEDLAGWIRRLVSDPWLAKIDRYADITFYKNEIERLKLNEDELAEVLQGSQRELKRLVEQLVYIAAISTARESGGRALSSLSEDLGVQLPAVPTTRGILAGIFWCILGLTLLWFAIPLAAPVVDYITGLRPMLFWPTSLEYAGLYLLWHVFPMFFAISITMIALSSRPPLGADGRNRTLSAILERNASIFISIIAFIVVYDYVMTLYEFGLNKVRFDDGFVKFFFSWLPYNILHSFISVTACLLVIMHISGNAYTDGSRRVYRDWIVMVAAVSVASMFYAQVRLAFQFGKPEAIDFVLLVMALNAAAASVGLLASRSVWRRRLDGMSAEPGGSPGMDRAALAAGGLPS